MRQELDRFLQDNEPGLVSLRRDLHRHPEVGWEEHRTSALVASLLADHGLSPTIRHGTALVYDVPVGASPDPEGGCIALRADIDALPIPDEKTVPYRSHVPGVSHSCGHDAHTTILVGVAQALVALGSSLPPGRVRLVFQPAEEKIPGGAEPLCALGVMDGVDAIFAVHCEPTLPVGTIGLRVGPTTSAAALVRIRLEGPGGHSARPSTTTDLIRVVGEVLTRLPDLVTDHTGPDQPARLVFGQVNAGLVFNVIPSAAELTGSLRTSSRTAWEAGQSLLAPALSEILAGSGAEFDLELIRYAPNLVNDAAATALFERAASDALGPDGVRLVEQSAGAEDFAWYLDRAPGAYGRLGVRSPEAAIAPALHTSRFDIDERALSVGIRVLIHLVDRFLSQSRG